jgi:hypothetical protein
MQTVIAITILIIFGGMIACFVGFTLGKFIREIPVIGCGKYERHSEGVNLAYIGGLLVANGFFLMFVFQIPSLLAETVIGTIFAGLLMSVFPIGSIWFIYNMWGDFWEDKKKFQAKCKALNYNAKNARDLDEFENRKEKENRNEQEKQKRINDERRKLEEDKQAWGDLYHEKLNIEEILQVLADDQLHLFDGMPPIKAYLVKEPKYTDVHPQGSSAYARGDEVFFKYDYYKDADMNSLVRVMKHEMTHSWIYWKGIKPDDPHGKEFQDKLKSIL